MKTPDKYKKSGQVAGAGALISLVVTVGVAILVLVLVGALGGQTYNLVEPDIDAINDTAIQANIKNGIGGGFEALEQTGSYMPLVVLAFIILIVLSLILGGLGGMAMNGGGRGSAL